MDIPNDKKFWESYNFWAMVIGCIAIAMGSDGVVSPEELNKALQFFAGGFMASDLAHKGIKALKKPELISNDV